MGINTRAMKAVYALLALLFVSGAAALEAQTEMKVEAKPFVPYMLATSPQLSPWYSMLYNPFSFIGYTNPQVEMFPHQLSVMKAFAGKKGKKAMYPGSGLTNGAGVGAQFGGLYGGAYLGGGNGFGMNAGWNPRPQCSERVNVC